jgi:5-methylcytosine-specific restriction endonuclease McrA
MAAGLIEQNYACRKCGQLKPRDSFQKNFKMKDGVTGTCKRCVADAAKVWYHASLDNSRRAKDNAAKRRMEKPAEVAEAKARWRQQNPDKCRAFHDKWARNNPVDLQETRRRAKANYRSNAKGRICANISEGVRASLKKGGKAGQKTFRILGYSVAELMLHLERKFEEGMCWENYGRNGWHIDHIIPLSAFNFHSVEHADFKRAWALSNLQPLWASENISKGPKLTGPFQPSLAI